MKSTIGLFALGIGIFVTTGPVQTQKPHERPANLPPRTVWLDRQPIVGQTLKYSLQFDFKVADLDGRLSGIAVNEVTKVEKDGEFTIVSKNSGTVEIMGTSISVPESLSTTVSEANGRIRSSTGLGSPPNEMRMALMLNIVYPGKPVREGESWSERIEADKKRGIVAAEGIFTFLGIEKRNERDTARVQVSYRELAGEHPMSSASDLYIDTRTGILVMSESTWKNVLLPGTDDRVEGRTILQLLEPSS